MMKDVDKAQADRIFRSCDKAGDGKISLQVETSNFFRYGCKIK